MCPGSEQLMVDAGNFDDIVVKPQERIPPVRKYLSFASIIFGAAFLACSFPCIGSAQSTKSAYYWVSHGSPTDPVWTLFLQGAKQWATDTGNEVRTSFHSGDVPSQQEAVRAAISAHAQEVIDGYVNAAMWQDPLASSYMALSVASMAASGIPPGFDIIVGTLYEKDKAPFFLKVMQGGKTK